MKAIQTLALVLLLMSAGCGRTEQPHESLETRPRAILLTTDTGADMDDQWVLAHLTLSPEFDLRGVVTTHTGQNPVLAAPAAESSAHVAREVLDQLPLSRRPKVIAGSSEALRAKAEPRLGPGVDFILRESRGFNRKRPLTVLVIGAATDLASALLADPSLAERIEIIAMAFSKWPEGNDPFNVKNDVKAWQVLLESPAPIVVADTVVALDDLRMTREHAQSLLEGRGEPGRYLAGLLVSWLECQGDLVQTVTDDRNSWPVWDEATVAYLLGLAKSEVHPRPLLRDDLKFEHPPSVQSSGPTVRWVTEINSEKLWEDFSRKLDHARRHQGTKQQTGEIIRR
jgi:inosine-uridine nucleoside N-ribohydrolase